MARSRRLSLAPPELSLVPLLDMVSLLIQVMLFNVQFGVYGALTSEVATASAGAAADARPVFVRVTEAGYDVTYPDGAERQVPCGGPCGAPEAWDVRGLRAAVTAGGTPPVDVALRPGTGVPFEVVVRTLDALAEREAGDVPLAVVSIVGGAP